MQAVRMGYTQLFIVFTEIQYDSRAWIDKHTSIQLSLLSFS